MLSECAGIQEQLSLTVERLSRVRQEYALETDPSRRFKYEMQIQQLEQEVSVLKKRNDECYGLGQTDYRVIGEAIQNLNIEGGLGEIHLVNCNRQSVVTAFWDAFEQYSQKELPFQFYFIPGCPTQQPNSFSERLVYEIILDELEEEASAINYVSGIDSRRVKKEKLPLRRNLKNSQKAFKKYFSMRFGLDQRKVRFEDYIETGIPKLEYDFVASVFEVNANDWSLTMMPKYMKWLFDTFKGQNAHIPTFVFFIVVNIRNLHDVLPKNLAKEQPTGRKVIQSLSQKLKGKEQKVFHSILNLVKQNPASSTLIAPLYPISVEYLEDWIRGLGETNQSRIDDAVDQIVSGLKEDKKARFYKDRILDMADIEVFQKMVYDWANGINR